MPALSSFDYAVFRFVPRVEREEFINVGVILFCRTRRFLGTRLHLDPQRVTAIAPQFDLRHIQAHLDLITQVAQGGVDAGPIGQLALADRFHWLTSPRSTVLQVSPVHCGLCDDPQTALDDLFDRLVSLDS